MLSSPLADPALVLSDGSNLLHAAVGMASTTCTQEHVTVLLQAVRQRLKPADFMGDAGFKQLPADLRFIEHRTPDGFTALYKVRATLAGSV